MCPEAGVMATSYNCKKKVIGINESQQIGLSFAVDLPAKAMERIATDLYSSFGKAFEAFPRELRE